jgi:D-sedoheptulose 7-phosphate isomerase
MAIVIEKFVEASIAAKREFFNAHADLVRQAAERIITALRSGNKLLLFGNGGSAADAQHIAAEFVNRYRADRPALAALALTTDSSVLTSIGNDSSYEEIFSRQIEALGQPGDVAIAISTSGNSRNVILAAERARSKGIFTIGLTGRDGGRLGAAVDLHLHVANQATARVQEVHILIAHILCEFVEEAFVP